MKFGAILVGLCFVWLAPISGLAQEAEAEPQMPEKAADAELLLFEQDGDLDDFQQLLRKSKELGVSDQILLEAEFLFYAEHQDEKRLAAMAPRLRAAVGSFNPESSKLFSTNEAFLSVVFYAEALVALEEGNLKLFESSIKEAFWNGPHQAAAFAETIERLRNREAMKKLILPLDQKFNPQAGGEAHSLSGVLGDGKGMLLHFWSPWHPECGVVMPTMAKSSEKLDKAGIRTIFVLAQAGEEQLQEAGEIRDGLKGPKSHWWVDREQGGLATPLRVSRLPMTVLLSPEGKVLYHGDTATDGMWQAVRERVPDFQVPAEAQLEE